MRFDKSVLLQLMTFHEGFQLFLGIQLLKNFSS